MMGMRSKGDQIRSEGKSGVRDERGEGDEGHGRQDRR